MTHFFWDSPLLVFKLNIWRYASVAPEEAADTMFLFYFSSLVMISRGMVRTEDLLLCILVDMEVSPNQPSGVLPQGILL